MSIQLLKWDGHWIIASVEEIPEVEYGDPDCVLKYPCEVTADGLVKFPPYSDDNEIVVRSSDITLISEPSAMYTALYFDMKQKEIE